jgi:hypothetical protein
LLMQNSRQNISLKWIQLLIIDFSHTVQWEIFHNYQV